MNDFCVCVATKGRPNIGMTLEHLSFVKDVHVVLYVHEPEKAVYSERYPDWEIVSHNFDNIVKIRGFIQEHQHERLNNFLMLDDDIKNFWYIPERAESENEEKWYIQSMTHVVNNAQELFEQRHDFIAGMCVHDAHFFRRIVLGWEGYESTEEWLPMLFACTGMTPKMYDIGMRLGSTTNRSEDIYMSAEVYVAAAQEKITIGRMDSMFDLAQPAEIQGNFGQSLYWDSIFQAYEQYGYLFDTLIDPVFMKIPHTQMNVKAINLYAKTGKKIKTPYYNKIYKEVYQKGLIRDTQFSYCEDFEQTCSHSKKTIGGIDLHEKFREVNPVVSSRFPDILVTLQMWGRQFHSMPDPITRENFHEGIEVLPDGTEVPAVWK